MLKTKRKPLTIIIDDQSEVESDIQLTQSSINQAIHTYQHAFPTSSFHLATTQEHDRKTLLSKSNSYLNQLLEYMESQNYLQDLSFQTILQNDSLKNIMQCIFISSDFQEIKNRDIQSEFSLIKLLTEDQIHKNAQLELSTSLKRNNNRYNDLTPYKYNAVSFKEHNVDIDRNNNYFNASYIDGPFKMDEKCFIATQGPLKSTISKFYQMIWENDIKLVLMLCTFEEEGRKKCENYLPQYSQELYFEENGMRIALGKEEWVIMGCLIKREINIIKEERVKTIMHVQMVNWPDYAEPDACSGYDTVLYLIQLIADVRERYQDVPVLLHCSAGTGRTGTLIAIFNLVKCLYFYKRVNYDHEIKPFFSVFNMVRRLREQRPKMVSSYEQYAFIYKFLIDWIQRNNEPI